MIGHLTMETIMVHDHIKQVPGFPDELRRHLLHLLLTHHGKLEYGSPKLPLTPEALLLSYLDDLDSKVEAMQRLIAEPHAMGDWTRMNPMFERSIYRVRTNETPTVELGAGAPTGMLEGIKESPKEASKEAPKKSAARAEGFNTPFGQLSELMKE
jgi:3'-5' exoribonuclease